VWSGDVREMRSKESYGGVRKSKEKKLTEKKKAPRCKPNHSSQKIEKNTTEETETRGLKKIISSIIRKGEGVVRTKR